MEVYLIPKEKALIWTNDTFKPLIDANGNHVVAVNADYSEHEFNEELVLCNVIEYVPPINSNTP